MSQSVLQANPVFMNKILARNSSAGSYSSQFDNYKTLVEIPFKWESRPGEPKHQPKEIEFSAIPARVDPTPPYTAARETHVPSRFNMRLSQTRVRCFLKKLIKKGQRRFNVHKNNHDVEQPSAGTRFSSTVAAARGFHSAEIRPSPCLFNNNTNNIESSNSSSSKGCNLGLNRSSKIQNISRGCVKWLF